MMTRWAGPSIWLLTMTAKELMREADRREAVIAAEVSKSRYFGSRDQYPLETIPVKLLLPELSGAIAPAT